MMFIKQALVLGAILLLLVGCHTLSCQKDKTTVPTPVSNPSNGGSIADTNHLCWGIDPDTGNILDKHYYVINFDCATHIPRWVAYYTTDSLLHGVSLDEGNFRQDDGVPDSCQASNLDYENNRYDKGHLAPAADFHQSAAACCSTYLYTNASPQVDSFNRKTWKYIEDTLREVIKNASEGWIVTGNLFLDSGGDIVAADSFIGPHHVAVPTHLFKAVLTRDFVGQYAAYAYLAPNRWPLDSREVGDYLISVDSLERVTEYDFFPILPDSIEARIESVGPPSGSVAKRNVPR